MNTELLSLKSLTHQIWGTTTACCDRSCKYDDIEAAQQLKLVPLSNDLLGIKMCDATSKFTKSTLFLQRLSKLELKFIQYFPGNLWSYEWIRDPFVQPTSSSFTLTRKRRRNWYFPWWFPKNKFNTGNPTNFWISLNDEYPALMKKSLRIVIPFAASYVCKVGFTAVGVLNAGGSFTKSSKIRLTSELSNLHIRLL